MDKRFTALRVIGTIYKVLAWFALMVGLLMAVLVLVAGLTLDTPFGVVQIDRGGALLGILVFLVTLLASVIVFLMLYAVGEFVYAFIAIEENTRRSAFVLQQLYVSGQMAYPPAPAEAAPLADEDLQ